MNASATVYEMRVMVIHIAFISYSIRIKYADGAYYHNSVAHIVMTSLF